MRILHIIDKYIAWILTNQAPGPERNFQIYYLIRKSTGLWGHHGSPIGLDVNSRAYEKIF